MSRPDCWQFSMNFLSSPEAEEIEKYVVQLEKDAARYKYLRTALRLLTDEAATAEIDKAIKEESNAR